MVRECGRAPCSQMLTLGRPACDGVIQAVRDYDPTGACASPSAFRGAGEARRARGAPTVAGYGTRCNRLQPHYHYSGNRGGPEKRRSMEDIREEARKNSWHIFGNEIPFSRGFPKIMRGD